MSDNIPYEIQMEIIKKVSDVKSLIRCRAVSKPWKSFVDTSEFITGYGAHDTSRLLLRYKDNSNEVKYVSFVDDDNNDTLTTQQQDFAINVPDLIKQLIYSQVIGSSCGLWGFYGYKNPKAEMVVIWNPSISKSVGIVVPRLLKTTSGRINQIGFGVFPSTYDPTIVGMSCFLRKTKPWQVGIFTLSSKAWKTIPSSNVPRQSIRLASSTQIVATYRFIFWVAYDRIADNGLILSFNLITNEFKEVNLPDSITKYFIISKLNESLVVSACTNVVNGRVYGVWMMGEEGGDMTSFTKLFNINTPDSAIRRLFGFRKSSKPIMETIKKDKEFSTLKVYEPCSKHINNLGIYGKKGSFFICPYTEALLLIDHSDGCIISSDY